jgi:cell division protein FtsW
MKISLLNKIRLDGDKIIWRIILFLFLFSVLAIFSSVSRWIAISNYKQSAFSFLINNHLIFFIGGFILMYICHRIPASVYKNFATLLLIISIGLLAYTLLFGVTLNSGARWISITANIKFQPVEIAKISVVLYMASILEDNVFENFKDVFRKIILPIGTVCLLTFIAGTSLGLVLGIICLSTLFIGGLKFKYLLKICGLALAALILLVALGVTVHWPPRVETAISRVATFLKKNNGNANTVEITQSGKAKIAVASGGFVGKGPGNSIQRYLLPNADTDFVFALIIEEYGLIVGILLLLIYMALLFRAAMIAKKCTRIFSSVTVLGLMLMIVFQALLNMGVSVGIFPVTGQTLPLISRGGTSILCTGIALGIILSVSRAANNQEKLQQKNDEPEKYASNDASEKTIEIQ